MKQVSVYNFENFRDYLCIHRGSRQQAMRFVTWSKRLGYRSPRAIAMVLNGQRLPSSEMISRLSRDLHHSEKEHRYFELLVEKSRRELKGQPIQQTLEELQKLRATTPAGRLISADEFSLIADWYHVVLRQLMRTRYFRSDLEWIKSRLRSKLSIKQIREGLQRIVDSASAREDHIRTSNDMPSEAVLSHHRQMLERAIESLAEQKFDQREVSSQTFAFSIRDLPAAKEAIRKFRDEFHQRFHRKNGDEVFQFNIQFFGHTNHSK